MNDELIKQKFDGISAEIKSSSKILQNGMDRIEQKVDSLGERMDRIDETTHTQDKEIIGLKKDVETNTKQISVVDKKVDERDKRATRNLMIGLSAVAVIMPLVIWLITYLTK